MIAALVGHSSARLVVLQYNRLLQTDAACSTSNNCAVQFSFTGLYSHILTFRVSFELAKYWILGSGITIYVLQAGPQGMSASLSIDSGSATTATLAAPPAPQYNIPHVVLFRVQNLFSGTHTAVMTVLDWEGGFSGMMLDYIDVNEAVVSASSSTTSNPTPTPTFTSTQTPTPTSSLSSSSQTLTSQSTHGLTTSSPSIASSVANQASPSSTTSTTPSTASDTSSQLLSNSKK